ncbi:hypothetical protein EVAR_54200_1 [Eumeta japonica]|uniref:Integrase catalytic domain-containing protein n=1 Tax=Eumeta variegata TaxID=151549 RepID=A0A4C1YC07_EUMVA|nr:hypothetical protein EVAR_54200_1 [Eumeta japonica]
MNIKLRTDEELRNLTYYLSKYDFQIKYSPGRYNIEADCLSRNPVLGANDNLEEQLKTNTPVSILETSNNFLEEKNIPIIFTVVDSPFSNGLNERLNQTLVNKIRCKTNENGVKKAWTTIAQNCVKIYNETDYTVTGYAPGYLLYGKDVTIFPNELKLKKTESDLIQDRRKALGNTIKSHNYNKKIYDKNRRHLDFKVGDTVFVDNGKKLNRKKLDELRIGPFIIIKKISNSIYKVNTNYRKSESNFFPHLEANSSA